ncbi:MAG TPA: glycogen debranching protein [Bryobacteraceae bacterium]|nr:glycogen debranching protein [Bryobacteraceae bacterium]
MANRIVCFACAAALTHALSLAAADLAPVPNFSQKAHGLEIVSQCAPRLPWTVAGEYGALLGRQSGKFEAWIWPNKILSNFSIQVQLADYPVPIDVNALAAEINVTPAETVVTYSHAAFTIRQHMFAVRGGQNPVAALAVYFELHSARAMEVTFSFTPEMLHMWPAPNYGRPNAEWVTHGNRGVYVLHTDDPSFSAVVAMPKTQPGIMPPYQERPQTYPVQFKLNFDPKQDSGVVYPLILGLVGNNQAYELASSIGTAIPALYNQTQDYYLHFFDHRTVIETPDRLVNEALRWAEVAVDQMQVKYRGDETGMVAGYYESGDSARPGYAWFFGRDTLWTTYAINSYGDFALTRRALDFLIRRQRADGKIMHEFSQSAYTLDWSKTPYFYAAADSAPLFVMAMRDYVRASGDIDYLKTNWAAVRKAYEFTRAHESGNGIYDNSQGTGWVESWPQGMPHQETYLAALDQQSAFAISELASLMSDGQLAAAAKKKAGEIKQTIESQFFNSKTDLYAFAKNSDGTLDETASIYPSVAWWDGTLALDHAGAMFTRWASDEFSADWGTRDISDRTPFYDPISYHQGSIWPLFTGWVSLAEYRAGRPLSGLAHLMQNASLTWAQDLGSVTELLSGEFYQPLGRSSSHQMWSSAMVIAPMLRGLFGVTSDVPGKTIYVNPHLPAEWDNAVLRNVAFGSTLVDLEFRRTGGRMEIRADSKSPADFCLTAAFNAACNPTSSAAHTLSIEQPAVELGIPTRLPQQGAETRQLKVLDEQISPRKMTFQFEADAESEYDLPLRLNRQGVTTHDAGIDRGKLHLAFPPGNGYQTKTVTFTW